MATPLQHLALMSVYNLIGTANKPFIWPIQRVYTRQFECPCKSYALHCTLSTYPSYVCICKYCCWVHRLVLHSTPSFFVSCTCRQAIHLLVFVVASIIFGFVLLAMQYEMSMLFTDTFQRCYNNAETLYRTYMFIFDRPYWSRTVSSILNILLVIWI